MDDVLLHSITRRLAKSIFVWMPRLPTIRVTGSQDMSTTFGGFFVSLMGASHCHGLRRFLGWENASSQAASSSGLARSSRWGSDGGAGARGAFAINQSTNS